MSANPNGWNPCAGLRVAGAGFANVRFNVTTQLDWLSFATTDMVDNALRFLNFTPKSGNSPTVGSVWPVPFDGASVKEILFACGTRGSGGTGYDLSIRVQGVNQHTMSVPVSASTDSEACDVALTKGNRVNLLQDGVGVVTSAKNAHVSLRIERTPP